MATRPEVGHRGYARLYSRPPPNHTMSVSADLMLAEPARPALDVANRFIQHSAYAKTPLQVQKLPYIAHGY